MREAQGYCEESLMLAASRQLVFAHIESLILRARIRMETTILGTTLDSAERKAGLRHALEDADNAVRSAKGHRYLRLQRDALLVLASGAEAGRRHAAKWQPSGARPTRLRATCWVIRPRARPRQFQPRRIDS